MPPEATAPRPYRWRPRAGDAAGLVALYALSRAVLVAVGVFAWGGQVRSSTWRGVDPAGVRYALVDDDPYLDMWTRWDSWQYEEIARKGYWYDFDFKPRPVRHRRPASRCIRWPCEPSGCCPWALAIRRRGPGGVEPVGDRGDGPPLPVGAVGRPPLGLGGGDGGDRLPLGPLLVGLVSPIPVLRPDGRPPAC